MRKGGEMAETELQHVLSLRLVTGHLCHDGSGTATGAHRRVCDTAGGRCQRVPPLTSDHL
ncbi:hypothetical protein B0T21DRAFT_17605 [Apiosordaria backusii]|uniref:Uncharacterized protein n=1 Tax=Apiosordaria backusii TaxID=314023 RepID=A0AA40K7F8_9PEZI|nr:hypothetical protein B0T21DRAFT_17605 [Apiosordaria backusii]